MNRERKNHKERHEGSNRRRSKKGGDRTTGEDTRQERKVNGYQNRGY